MCAPAGKCLKLLNADHMSVRMAAFGVKGNKRDFTNAVKAFLELKLEKFMNRADHATIDDAMEEAR